MQVDTSFDTKSKKTSEEIKQTVSITPLDRSSPLYGVNIEVDVDNTKMNHITVPSKVITMSMTETNEKNVSHSIEAFELHGKDGVMECKEIPSEGGKEVLKKYMNEKIGVLKEICEKVGKDTAVSTKIHVRIGNLDITMNMSKGGKKGKGTTINCVMESLNGKDGKQVNFTVSWNKGKGFYPMWDAIENAQ